MFFYFIIEFDVYLPLTVTTYTKDSFFGESYSDLRALSIIEAHYRHTGMAGGGHSESSERKLSDEKESIALFSNLDLSHLETESTNDVVFGEGNPDVRFSTEHTKAIELKNIVVTEETDGNRAVEGVNTSSSSSSSSSSIAAASNGGGHLVANLQDIEDMLDTMDMGITPSTVNAVHRKSE